MGPPRWDTRRCVHCELIGGIVRVQQLKSLPFLSFQIQGHILLNPLSSISVPLTVPGVPGGCLNYFYDRME